VYQNYPNIQYSLFQFQCTVRNIKNKTKIGNVNADTGIEKEFLKKELKLQIQVYVTPFSGHLGREVRRDKELFPPQINQEAKKKKMLGILARLVQMKHR
jgi:hypothetical protein